jgi:hypothetical protein
MTEFGSQRFAPRFNIKEMDEDLYSGYNEYDSAFETKNIENDEFLQEALRTSHGRRTALVINKTFKCKVQCLYRLLYYLLVKIT